MARPLRWAALRCVGGCVAVVAPPSSAPKAAALGVRGQVDEKRVDLTPDPERGRSATALDGGATTAGALAGEGSRTARAVGPRSKWRCGVGVWCLAMRRCGGR